MPLLLVAVLHKSAVIVVYVEHEAVESTHELFTPLYLQDGA